MIPAIEEYGPIVLAVREEARVPDAKKVAVRRPNRMLITHK
jgi:hypothetical protein